MREVALHILDLVENAVRAEARVIALTVDVRPAADRLWIVIEDDGPGLPVAPEDAANPFFTTKQGKRTGLGLSLFRAAAEQTGGGLTIGQSPLGGVAVTVEMGLTHVDRSPLGDLAGTLGTVVCANPELDFRFRLKGPEREIEICVTELAADARGNVFALAQRLTERVQQELETVSIA
jgi:anti-sigma regulatory factor (Ser/Thr protein kinase)